MFYKLIIICSMIYLVQSNKTCKDTLRELADGQMKFVQCVTVNSVPITACNNCQDRYQYMFQMYNILLSDCSNIYFDKDRINLISSAEFALTSLWSKAYCDDCFNNNNTEVFNQKNEDLSYCLLRHSKTPCENCKSQYLELNNFYINLDQHNNGEVCYDLQDSMNRTRNKWSKELNCCRREQNLTLFMVVLGITSCLPLLFYGSTYCITKRQERSQRVLYDEEPYNSEVPSSSSSSAPQQNNTNDLNNRTQSVLANVPSSSNIATVNAGASLPPKNFNEPNNNSDNDMESSDDELLINTVFKPKEKIKNI